LVSTHKRVVDISGKHLRYNVRTITTISIVILSSLIIMPHAYSIGFESLNNLSNDSIYSTDPQVVVSGSKVYAVWTSFDGATADILFKVSTDGGLTFGSIISLSSNAEAIPLLACDDTNPMECRGYPQLAVSGSSVYVIWQDNDKIDDDGDGLFRLFRHVLNPMQGLGVAASESDQGSKALWPEWG